MRDFSKVSPKLWRSGRFRDLSDDARLLYLFLLTCEHQTSAGVPDYEAIRDRKRASPASVQGDKGLSQ